jgi:hypothetical protein
MEPLLSLSPRFSVSREKRGADWYPGLLSGSEIRKYIVNYEGNFIRFNTKIIDYPAASSGVVRSLSEHFSPQAAGNSTRSVD